ncbi:uncharacterized protein K452DRAFT_290339 [Aplosporella prunicola CBS 121167]|uniref:Uncharacterized protein n=1 Tax=Aplosporella prunicola CBS 121167 TaxID=1176127 RepID=A0A6A6B5X2_9PEZI|nr:uncharacterized protein K452DRAFT_290339 [Aplosporella prunicola CBS 121167]KAF2138685.1 hypothetical protein K452DRAFT_290339 [Aplosporella prunicola CBS 121167]
MGSSSSRQRVIRKANLSNPVGTAIFGLLACSQTLLGHVLALTVPATGDTLAARG